MRKQQSRLAGLILIFVFLLTCSYTHAATWYVSQSGNDSNSGTGPDPGDAWLTISKGITTMDGGDTLNVGVGTYNERISSIPNGTSGNDTTIQNYGSEVVWLEPTGTDMIIDFESGAPYRYITIDGINLQGLSFSSRTGGNSYGMKLRGSSSSVHTHHITIKNMEIDYMPDTGILESYYTSYNSFINVTAHDGGDEGGAGNQMDYAFYMSGLYTLMDGCVAYNNTGHGFTMYSNTSTTDQIMKNCVSFDNGPNPTKPAHGFAIYSGPNHKIYNCLAYGNTGSGILIDNEVNIGVYNNTTYNNDEYGITTQMVGGVIRNNIIYLNTSGDIQDNGSGITIDHNLTTDPSFTNAADPDGVDNTFRTSDDGLHIQTGSAAKDAADANVGGLFNTDIIYPTPITRPQGDAWDIGAYEFVESGDPDIEAPTTPTDLSATKQSQSQIDLTWTASTDDTAVVGYRIYRDDFVVGNEIAEIGASTSHSDTSLTEGTLYEYKVSAFDLADNESGQSVSASDTTDADTTKPTIVGGGVNAISNVLVGVVFSEDVELASAETTGNYSIDLGITVSAAVLQADLNTVYLTVSTLTGSTTYTLTVNNVKDRATTPNTMDQATPTFSWSEGLVFYLPFLESEGQQPIDQSGGGSTCTLGTDTVVRSDDPTYTAGYIGDGLLFDGDDDIVKLINASVLNTMTSFTFSAWVYLNGYGGAGFGRLLTRETAMGIDQIYWHVDDGDALGSSVFNATATEFSSDGGLIDLDFGVWFKFLLKYDNAGDRKQHLYLDFGDGDEVGTYTTQEALTGDFGTSTNSFYVGNAPKKTTGLDGKLDQVKIYNRITTQQEDIDDYDADVAARAAEVPVFSMRGIATGSIR